MPINLPPQNVVAEPAAKTAAAINTLGAVRHFLRKLSSIPISEKLFFVQNLGIMLKAGISLSVALKTLSKQTNNKRLAGIINDISANVEKGISFTESLKPHEKIFGQLFVSMIESGEISGKLEEVLKRLYIQFKKNHELVAKVKGALTYPLVILAAMSGIGVFMMIFVIPKITAMFKDFNAELPLATKLLIKLSNSLIADGWLYLIGLAVLILIFSQSIKTAKGKYLLHGLLLKMPIFAPIIKKINLARFARTISSLLKTDIMIIKSFQITANVLGNIYYRDGLNDMAGKIKKGGTINEVIANYPKLFPPIVAQMIAVGEETGELDHILEELAEFYEGEIDQTMNNLPAIIEPILILLLGLVVGGMAVAVIMPMYSLTSAI
ncbi:MAG: type II secretion system F family protein [Parcubacteria group bacterium]|nr:type II secretion system F family protein [Parcubacteria group bacterium]